MNSVIVVTRDFSIPVNKRDSKSIHMYVNLYLLNFDMKKRDDKVAKHKNIIQYSEIL